jgi:dihydrofolate reductase
MLSVIVAASENHVIGKDNALPWNLPDDLQRFRALTKGKTVIMGRKTYESIGRPLPDRRNIVVSHRKDLVIAGCEVAHSLDEAVSMAGPEGEVFVIGGASLLIEGMRHATRLYLTRVHATIDGDVQIPQFNLSGWTEMKREDHSVDSKHAHAFTFIDYQRG